MTSKERVLEKYPGALAIQNDDLPCQWCIFRYGNVVWNQERLSDETETEQLAWDSAASRLKEVE